MFLKKMIKIGNNLRKDLSDLNISFKIFKWSFLFKTSIYWILPTTIFVYVFYKIPIINREYIEHALNEAISPFLWNVLGVIGIFTAGMSILSLCISYKISAIFSKIAHKILSMTYEMGFLIIGILVGKSILNFKPITLPMWEKWFYGVSLLLLFFIVFSLNIMLWSIDQILINVESKNAKACKLKPKWIFMFFGIVLILLSILGLIFAGKS